MHCKKIIIGLTLIAVGTQPAFLRAQESIEKTAQLDSAIKKTYQSIKSQEIRIKGVIGSMVGDQLYFVDGTGRYKIELDAGREVRHQIDGCEIQIFQVENSPCQVEGMAEITIDEDDDDIADGLEVGLILYQVDAFRRNEDTQ